MLRVSLIVCLLTAGAMAQVELQDYKYAAPRFNFDEDGTLYNKVKDFFDFENAGQTTLGKILAWKGDLIQPTALFGLSVFAVYTLIRICLTLLSGVIDLNTGVLGKFLKAVGDLNTAFFNRLAGITDPEDDTDDTTTTRRRREILDVADRVYQAIQKYQD